MLIERVCLALMLALVGDVFLGVFSRYILQATFQWYDEVAVSYNNLTLPTSELG